MKKITSALALAALLVLSGCGFHLRGKVDLPESMSSVFVKGSEPDLILQLEDMLTFSGADVMTSPQGAKAIVDLTRVDYRREVRTQDARGLATGYQLIYNVEFKVIDQGGKTLIDDGKVNVRRTINFDATQVLQAEQEENFLRAEMRKDAALRILRQLSKV